MQKTQDGIGEVAAVETLKEMVRVKFHENGEVFFKKYSAKDIVVVKDATTENDKIEMDSEEDLQELQKMEKLDREEKWNHKAKDKK